MTMPKTGKQWVAVATVGGLAYLSGNIAQNVFKQHSGLGGFVAAVSGGAGGALLGLAVLQGKGVKLA